MQNMTKFTFTETKIYNDLGEYCGSMGPTDSYKPSDPFMSKPTDFGQHCGATGPFMSKPTDFGQHCGATGPYNDTSVESNPLDVEQNVDPIGEYDNTPVESEPVELLECPLFNKSLNTRLNRQYKRIRKQHRLLKKIQRSVIKIKTTYTQYKRLPRVCF